MRLPNTSRAPVSLSSLLKGSTSQFGCFRLIGRLAHLPIMHVAFVTFVPSLATTIHSGWRPMSIRRVRIALITAQSNAVRSSRIAMTASDRFAVPQQQSAVHLTPTRQEAEQADVNAAVHRFDWTDLLAVMLTGGLIAMAVLLAGFTKRPLICIFAAALGISEILANSLSKSILADKIVIQMLQAERKRTQDLLTLRDIREVVAEQTNQIQNSLRSEAARGAVEVENRNKHIVAAIANFDASLKQLSRSMSDNFESLRTIASTHTLELKRLCQEMDQTTAELAKDRRRYEDIRSEFDASKAKLERMQAEINSHMRSELNARTELAELSRKFERHDSLRDKLDVANQKVQSMQQELSSRERALEDSKSRLESSALRMREWQRKAVSLQRQNKRLASPFRVTRQFLARTSGRRGLLGDSRSANLDEEEEGLLVDFGKSRESQRSRKELGDLTGFSKLDMADEEFDHEAASGRGSPSDFDNSLLDGDSDLGIPADGGFLSDAAGSQSMLPENAGSAIAGTLPLASKTESRGADKELFTFSRSEFNSDTVPTSVTDSSENDAKAGLSESSDNNSSTRQNSNSTPTLGSSSKMAMNSQRLNDFDIDSDRDGIDNLSSTDLRRKLFSEQLTSDVSSPTQAYLDSLERQARIDAHGDSLPASTSHGQSDTRPDNGLLSENIPDPEKAHSVAKGRQDDTHKLYSSVSVGETSDEASEDPSQVAVRTEPRRQTQETIMLPTKAETGVLHSRGVNEDDDDNDLSADAGLVVDVSKNDSVPSSEAVDLESLLTEARELIRNARRKDQPVAVTDDLFSRATSNLKTIVRTTDNSVNALAEYGAALLAWAKSDLTNELSHQRLKEASHCLALVIEQFPNDEVSLFNRGLCLCLIAASQSSENSEDLYSEACELYSRLLQLNPSSKVGAYNCALAFISRARLAEARPTPSSDVETNYRQASTCLERALDLEPSDLKAKSYLEECKRALQKPSIGTDL